MFALSRLSCPWLPARSLSRLLTAQAGGLRASYDVAIAGGGIMGCASAYFLAVSGRVPASSICIIERDVKYEKASTPLSVGSVRQQFSVEGNILMSIASITFLRDIANHLSVPGEEPVNVQLVENGYLFLAQKKTEDVMRENFQLQRSLGACVQLLDPPQLQKKFPWLNTNDIALGSYGYRNEGWFDPWALLSAFKKKAISMGVRFIQGEVTGVDVGGERIKTIVVAHPSSGEQRTLHCGYLVNTTGAWAAGLARLVGVGDDSHLNPAMRTELPVRRRKRNVFVFHCPDGPVGNVPLLVDPSGFYFRTESRGAGHTYLCGMESPEDKDCYDDDLEVDYSLFDMMWPLLAGRIPAFQALKLKSAWAGFYDYNTFDQNAIIGIHPVVRNLVLANGFSGHGIQQAPAVGRAVSELIINGETQTIDLEPFSFERIIEGRPLIEKNVIG